MIAWLAARSDEPNYGKLVVYKYPKERLIFGPFQVEGRPAAGLRVSRKGNRDITLYFDQKTHLLVKTETRVKDEGSGQEVTEETVLSAHAEKGARQAMKLTTQRDGKPFLEAEVVEFKVEAKLDDSVFAKP